MSIALRRKTQKVIKRMKRFLKSGLLNYQKDQLTLQSPEC